MGTHPIFESDFDCLTEIMGGYSDELDRYLQEYEEKIGKTLRVPEQLIQRKLINQSIESAEHKRNISHEPVMDKSQSPCSSSFFEIGKIAKYRIIRSFGTN